MSETGQGRSPPSLSLPMLFFTSPTWQISILPPQLAFLPAQSSVWWWGNTVPILFRFRLLHSSVDYVAQRISAHVTENKYKQNPRNRMCVPSVFLIYKLFWVNMTDRNRNFAFLCSDQKKGGGESLWVNWIILPSLITQSIIDWHLWKNMPVSVSKSCRQHLQTTDWSVNVSTTKGKSHYTSVNREKQQICSEHNIFSLDFLPPQVSGLTLSTRLRSNQPVDTMIKTS